MIAVMESTTHKACARCEQVKPLTDFTADKRAKDGRYSACKQCNAEAAKARRAVDPAPSRAAVAKWRKATPENAALTAKWIKESKARNPELYRSILRRSEMKRRYGMTPEEYVHKLETQGFVCGICETTDPGQKGFNLDHDHETGAVREFLCGACNMGLGQFGDDPDRLIAAAMYLMRHKGTLETLLPELKNRT